MSRHERQTSHDELIQNYLENQATPTEEKHFRLLLGEESFRRRVAEYAIDLGCLHLHARQGLLEAGEMARSASVDPVRRRMVVSVAAAASLLLVLAGAWVLSHAWRPSSHQGPSVAGSQTSPQPDLPHGKSQSPSTAAVAGDDRGVGKLAHVAGRVVATRPDLPGEQRTLETDDVLDAGDELETLDPESFALVEFGDGTLLAVAGESKLACLSKENQKRVALSAGNLMAQVAPQPESFPMLIRTPVAEAEVLGTKLSLFTDADLTEVAVQEGRVLFRRLADGQAVDVQGGQCAVARANADLAARPIDETPTVWEEDFDTGLPNGWKTGMWIRPELLADSNGAVRAVARSEDAHGHPAGPCFAMTQSAWSRGLFQIEANSHLNFRYKLMRPGWFYVLINARTDEDLAAFSGCFLFKNRSMCQVPRNQWETRSVPLNCFHRPKRHLLDKGESLSPHPGNIVFSLFFRTQETDPGLIIDRIWVTQGTPDNVETLDWSE